MYDGFYKLASGMLTQSRNLNVIGNNMVNVQTPGYKQDTMVSTTFQEEMLYRTGRTSKANPEPLATTSRIKAADRTYVNYEQGSFEVTDGIFDVALSGKGFFCIQTAGGERYTRNGAFAVDNEGYLELPGVGRVLSTENQPIHIDNEDFSVDSRGNITFSLVMTGEEGDNYEVETEVQNYGTLKVVDFADYDQLQREDNGIFSTGQAQIPTGSNGEETKIIWQSLEKSNVNMVNEMTAMMSAQRALQGAAQALKMYDQIMSKSVVEIGRLLGGHPNEYVILCRSHRSRSLFQKA